MLGKPVALRKMWALLNGNLSIDNLQLLRASGPLPVNHSYQGLTWGAAVRFGSDVRAAPAAASLGPSAWSVVEPKQPFWSQQGDMKACVASIQMPTRPLTFAAFQHSWVPSPAWS